ncbi:helix-turn-helix domain-containing protein [Phosphitispora fastidiosa]|uniref:helix-turn-helix domain-containing protein n=1 Tax=Phosphitispora fastidiosa TaxID=2837202 RepID=UPI001E3A8A1C|nr:PAS domain S-box-containing protein [Phosphitispora fastidiosa]
MNKIKLVIVGADSEGTSLYYCFRDNPKVEITGIVDLELDSNVFSREIENEVAILKSIEQLSDYQEINLIVNTVRNPSISEKINEIKNSNTLVIESSSLELLVNLADCKEKAEAELFSLLNSAQDAIIIVDRHGFVKFINKTFEKYLGLRAKEFLNHNIFEKYPGSPFDHCAKCGQQIVGQRYSFGDDTKEFSYTVTPINVRESLTGVIGVFRLSPDIFRLMEELQRSTSIIEGLYDRLGQINGLDELNISDVMAIDKMERIMLRHALTRFGYSVEGKKKAAKALNISLATLYNKLKKYQIS